MRTKPLTRQEILADILVTTKYTPKVLSGFLISGIVSVFGLYPLVASFFKTETALYITIAGFVGLLILVDSVKRGTLTRYFNSKLKHTILGSKVRKGYLNMSLIAIVFVLLIDGAGAWLTGVAGQKYYTENKTTQSEEYKILQQNAQSGQTTANNYALELEAWKETKTEAYANCDDKWKGWKAKYKAKCKEEWSNFNPMPKQTTTGQIKIDDYKDIENDNKSFLDSYLQYIIFLVLVLLTGLLQYLTISEIKEDYEDIEDSLTPNRITNLQTALATAQDIEEQHEKATFENKEQMQEKKNEQLREMKLLEDKREIVLNAKAVSNGNEGLKRIANNNAYVPQDESKAGFVATPTFSFNQPKEDPQHEVKAETKQGMSDGYIIMKLWRTETEQEAKAGDKLTPKTKIININKRKEVEQMSMMYKALVNAGYAELRGNKGYFALVDFDDIDGHKLFD